MSMVAPSTVITPVHDRGCVLVDSRDLTVLLCLDRSPADAEPKALRSRILHTAVRLVRGQRKRKIKIPEAWPWAHDRD
jgi:hypothetical protein